MNETPLSARQSSAATEEISLFELWLILWRSRWTIIGVTAVFALLSIPYALMQQEWYRAAVLLSPAEERTASDFSRQFGGLVSLAGVSVGGQGSTEPLAILASRDFLSKFIESQNLLPVLYSGLWDEEAGSWVIDGTEAPDIRDAVETFQKSVLKISEDPANGLVSLTIRWTDPELAAVWANLLVVELNEHLRQRALAEAQSNVAYLQGELAGTTVVTLQQSIGRLMETEMQKLMLARGNDEFAFRVIDSAQAPKTRFKPRRTLIVVLATFLGGVFSVLLVFGLHAFRAVRERADT